MEEFFRVGVVSSTHGLRGEVKVFPTTDDPGRFPELKKIYADKNGKRTELQLEKARFFKNMVICKFKGIDRIEDIEGYKGAELYVERTDAIPLDDDEYYIADLIGMTVSTSDGELLGTLADVITTAANDVYCVKTEKYGEILIPAIHDCIKEVDPEAGTMTVELLPGLI